MRGSHRPAQRQGGGGERLRLLTPEPTGFARGLDRSLLDIGDGALEFVGVLSAYGDQTGGPEDAVSGGEVGLLLEDVVVLR